MQGSRFPPTPAAARTFSFGRFVEWTSSACDLTPAWESAIRAKHVPVSDQDGHSQRVAADEVWMPRVIRLAPIPPMESGARRYCNVNGD